MKVAINQLVFKDAHSASLLRLYDIQFCMGGVGATLNIHRFTCYTMHRARPCTRFHQNECGLLNAVDSQAFGITWQQKMRGNRFDLETLRSSQEGLVCSSMFRTDQIIIGT